jgi:hypothetical protein
MSKKRSAPDFYVKVKEDKLSVQVTQGCSRRIFFILGFVIGIALVAVAIFNPNTQVKALSVFLTVGELILITLLNKMGEDSQ